MDSRELRNAYMREWRKKNKDKVKMANKRYWENKAFIQCESLDILIEMKECENKEIKNKKERIDLLLEQYEKKAAKEEKEMDKIKKILDIRILLDELEEKLKEVEGEK